MTQHLNQPVRVAELAAQASVSPSHFFALFKRLTGHAPIDYLIRLRMRRARALLDSTTASVKEIAVTLGYKDPLYFSRVFKAAHLAAPTQYRARPREFRSAGGRVEPTGKISRNLDSAPRFNGASHQPYQFA